MFKNNIIFVIPGGGGKTTLSKQHDDFIDIDDYWNIKEEVESKMIKEFNEAQENNNTDLIQKLIKDCMNYKALKLKNSQIKQNSIILVQSIEQANIITNDKNTIFCFVHDKDFHEMIMDKRKDSNFVKEVCRMQRKDIIDSGWNYKCYNSFKELDILIDEIIK